MPICPRRQCHSKHMHKRRKAKFDNLSAIAKMYGIGLRAKKAWQQQSGGCRHKARKADARAVGQIML